MGTGYISNGTMLILRLGASENPSVPFLPSRAARFDIRATDPLDHAFQGRVHGPCLPNEGERRNEWPVWFADAGPQI